MGGGGGWERLDTNPLRGFQNFQISFVMLKFSTCSFIPRRHFYVSTVRLSTSFEMVIVTSFLTCRLRQRRLFD